VRQRIEDLKEKTNKNLKDCVDDYSPEKFKFDNCIESNKLKCDDGRCFNLTMVTGELGNCTGNNSLL
jgi:hypothetical protein